MLSKRKRVDRLVRAMNAVADDTAVPSMDRWVLHHLAYNLRDNWRDLSDCPVIAATLQKVPNCPTVGAARTALAAVWGDYSA